MKQYISLFLAACLLSCAEEKKGGEQQKDGLLSTDLVHNPISADSISLEELEKLPVMKFTDTVHDFGIVHEGEKVTHEFEFVNTGRSPLIISNASSSCGCTVPQYPAEPVAPGKGGILKVEFNSADKSGYVEKAVFVHTNSVRGIYTLSVKAEVKK